MKRVMLALLFGSVSASANADFIGLYVGGGVWQSDFKGDVIDNVALDTDLNVDGTTANYFYAAFEHPIPLIPNVRVDRTVLDDSGQGTLGSDFSFAGQTFSASQPVTSTLDLTHTDFTLYYELWDTGGDFDLGITGRRFDGEVIVNTAREDVEGTLPMLYGKVKLGLPFTGTYLTGNIKTIGDRHTDFSAAVGWSTENFILPEFGVEGGYRNIQIDVDADDVDVNVDAEFDGVYVTLNAHF